MVPRYTLSYNGYTYVNEEKVSIYRWVRVQPHQIKDDADGFPVRPELKQGQTVKYRVDGNLLMFKVLGNGDLRVLSSKEKEDPGMTVRI